MGWGFLLGSVRQSEDSLVYENPPPGRRTRLRPGADYYVDGQVTMLSGLTAAGSRRDAVAVACPAPPRTHVRRGAGWSRRLLDAVSLAQVSIAAGVVLDALLRGASGSDFEIFYEFLERASAGLPLYGPLTAAGRAWLQGPNLNPPHFYVVVAPFALLSAKGAYVAWIACGALAAGYAAAVSLRALRARWTPAAAALVLSNAAFNTTVRMGQLSALLAVPVTIAWRAARESRWVLAGVSIGAAASVKPFLLICIPYLLLKGKIRATWAACAAAAACTLTGALVFGPDAIRDWVGVLAHQPRMETHFFNAAFRGIVARSLPGDWLPVASIASVIGVAVTVWRAVRTRDMDLAWLLLMTGALLWSPLGWVYYGWLLMPPAAALILRGALPRAVWIGALLWCCPAYDAKMTAMAPFIAGTVGSIYGWGLLIAWGGCVFQGGSVTTTGAPGDGADESARRASRPGETAVGQGC